MSLGQQRLHIIGFYRTILIDQVYNNTWYIIRSVVQATADSLKGGRRMNTYYNPDDLAKFGTMGEEAPALWDAFMAYYGGVMADGALTAREKALIALAIAHADKCPYCIDSYTQTCLQMGIDEEEMTEAVHVAAAMKAGITLVHGVQMKNIVDKLEM